MSGAFEDTCDPDDHDAPCISSIQNLIIHKKNVNKIFYNNNKKSSVGGMINNNMHFMECTEINIQPQVG
jgi:hypothetical protein